MISIKAFSIIVLCLFAQALPISSALKEDPKEYNQAGDPLLDVFFDGCKSFFFYRDSEVCAYGDNKVDALKTALCSEKKANVDYVVKNLSREILYKNLFLHKVILSDFGEGKQHKNLTEERKIEVLRGVVKRYGCSFISQIFKEKLEGKTAFDCSIMQEQGWLKGALFLLANGLVRPHEYRKLGLIRKWSGEEKKHPLFNVNFKPEDRKLANQAFLEVVKSWQLYFQHKEYIDKEKDKENFLIIGACSLFNYFNHIDSYEGFPIFWRKSYYYKSFIFLLRKTLECTQDGYIPTIMTERIGDIYRKQLMYKEALNEYLKCQRTYYLAITKRYEDYFRVSEKMSSCYRESGDLGFLEKLNLEVSQVKINIKANLDVKENDGITPLISAAIDRHKEIRKPLTMSVTVTKTKSGSLLV